MVVRDEAKPKPVAPGGQGETYMGVFVEEVEAVLIDSQNAGSHDGAVAAALNVEEGRAEHGEGADQPWGGGHRRSRARRCYTCKLND